MNKHLACGSALTAIMILSTGCAKTEPPHTALSKAQSAVSAAEAKGAQKVPDASLYLKMAKDGIDQAEALMNEDEHERAAAVLERARVDAELAISLATEEDMKNKAQEQMNRAKSLQQSNNAQMAASAAHG